MFDLDHPVCICSAEMQLKSIVPTEHSTDPIKSEIHTFRCAECQHELRVLHDLPQPPV
jgi:acetone carboxylase gamma subunit